MSSAIVHELKVPPHNIDAEQSVIGGLLLAPDAWDRISDVIASEDFYRQDHSLIFGAVNEMLNQGIAVDVVTVSEWLENRDQLNKAGGLVYLGELQRNTPSAANIEAYADIVREQSIKRRLLGAAASISASVHARDGRPVDELLNHAEQHVFDVRQCGMRRDGPVAAKEILPAVVDRIDDLYKRGSLVTGLATGFSSLDDLTAGLQPGNLIVIAARPSMGKTALAINIAQHVAISERRPVVIFSLEMTREELMHRAVAAMSGINLSRVMRGKIYDDEWTGLTQAFEAIGASPLFIDETPAIAPLELRSKVRRLMREQAHGLSVVIVDYLQLMRVPGMRADHKTAEVTEISGSLKQLAKEMRVPVIALAQLNRGVEYRADKRPMMSDLRESGSIEQDADLVMMLYRDEVYTESPADAGKAELIIRKHRNGPCGTVRLTFSAPVARFTSSDGQ